MRVPPEFRCIVSAAFRFEWDIRRHEMAATGRDVQSQELNALFQFLGELDEDDKLWKEQSHFVSEIILLFKPLWLPMEFRVYGSEAEDLKCYFSNDTGDIDIIIFQDSDDCIIYEEMLEYSPENLMHVRIKGADHPLFKSCLVEDTQYLETSAL